MDENDIVLQLALAGVYTVVVGLLAHVFAQNLKRRAPQLYSEERPPTPDQRPRHRLPHLTPAKARVKPIVRDDVAAAFEEQRKCREVEMQSMALADD